MKTVQFAALELLAYASDVNSKAYFVSNRDYYYFLANTPMKVYEKKRGERIP